MKEGCLEDILKIAEEGDVLVCTDNIGHAFTQDGKYTVQAENGHLYIEGDCIENYHWTDSVSLFKILLTPPTAMDNQVGGTHYKDLGIQPLELTLKNMGLEAFEGACYTKINKYMIRNKDDKVEQLKKARHVLDMWIEEVGE